jgi:hypothetical protein
MRIAETQKETFVMVGMEGGLEKIQMRKGTRKTICSYETVRG